MQKNGLRKPPILDFRKFIEAFGLASGGQIFFLTPPPTLPPTPNILPSRGNKPIYLDCPLKAICFKKMCQTKISYSYGYTFSTLGKNILILFGPRILKNLTKW